MADTNLVALLFQAQSLHRKPASRIRTTPDGREILLGYRCEQRRREVLKRDGYLCVSFGSSCNVEVHHKQKRASSAMTGGNDG